MCSLFILSPSLSPSFSLSWVGHGYLRGVAGGVRPSGLPAPHSQLRRRAGAITETFLFFSMRRGKGGRGVGTYGFSHMKCPTSYLLLFPRPHPPRLSLHLLSPLWCVCVQYDPSRFAPGKIKSASICPLPLAVGDDIEFVGLAKSNTDTCVSQQASLNPFSLTPFLRLTSMIHHHHHPLLF